MKSTRTALATLLLCASAFAVVGCGSTANSVVSPDLDNAPPASPTGVQVTHDAAINIDDLVWSPSASANVGAYEIHRYGSTPSGNAAGDDVILVGADQTSLRLPLVNSDRTEFYRVRAISSSDVASAYSGSAQADRLRFQGGNTGDHRDDGGRNSDTIE